MTDLPDGVAHWDGPGLDAWRPWTPAEAAERLAGVGIPWCVVGGWAIDLFAGGQTRPHGDLEIAVGRPDLPAVRRALPGHRFHVVGDGEVRALPAGADPPADRHQNWVLDVAAGAWRMDVMLEPGDRDTWVYRRDPTVRAPRAAMVGATPDGIPYLRPPAVLLFKARAVRPKDEHDLRLCLPRLDPGERAWLARALARADPAHPWLAELT
jgi:Aminoglycoside-2''-adenylyltransferase